MSVQFRPTQEIDHERIFAISYSFVNQVTANPAVQKDLADPLKLFYRSESLDPVSAYQSVHTSNVIAISADSKSLRLKCPLGRKPEKLSIKLPMNMKSFTCAGTAAGPLEFQFETKDAQMLRIKKLTRRLTFLPWDNTIQVSESYEFVHEGFRLPENPSFNRLEYARLLHRNKGVLKGTQIIPRIMLVVPNTARGIQIRDEVGINWAPIQRQKIENGFDAVSVAFRFPLIGGMSSAFDFHYTLPASTLISPFQSQSSPFKKLLQTQMVRLAVDAPIDKLKIILALPEDSSDIEYEFGTAKVAKVTRRRYRSYFSTTGENELTFEFENMTRDDADRMMAVLFNYPWWGVFRKPLVAVLSIISLIAVFVFGNKQSFSLLPAANSKQTRAQLRRLFDKRRQLLLDLEDLITVNLNTKAGPEQQKADAQQRAQLEEQIRSIENAIFEKVKNNAKDPQMSTLNSIALKKLYDDQIGLVRSILAEACNKSSSSSNQSIDSLDTLGSQGSVASMRMSKSSSADLLKRPQLNEHLKALSNDACNIDSQISVYESKFL